MQDPADTIPVITIDGPSGAGKGTLAWLLADQLGWHILDSGAMYRLMALNAQRQGISSKETTRLVASAEQLDVLFKPDQTGVSCWLNQENVSASIRTEQCAGFASEIATIADLRLALLNRQRDFKQAPGLIADGRDMGTIVFPEAEVKIFLTASHQARLQRRYNELKRKGLNIALTELEKQFAGRDQQDQNRAIAPLKPALDAVTIDTTDLPVKAVLARVLKEVTTKLKL